MSGTRILRSTKKKYNTVIGKRVTGGSGGGVSIILNREGPFGGTSFYQRTE